MEPQHSSLLFLLPWAEPVLMEKDVGPPSTGLPQSSPTVHLLGQYEVGAQLPEFRSPATGQDPSVLGSGPYFLASFTGYFAHLLPTIC